MRREPSATREVCRADPPSPTLLTRRVQTALRMICITVIVILATLSRFRTRVTLPANVRPMRIDINTATKQELTLMPGIGSTMADRILTDRETRGAFESVDDLTRVYGIGRRTVAELAPYCKVRLSPGNPH